MIWSQDNGCGREVAWRSRSTVAGSIVSIFFLSLMCTALPVAAEDDGPLGFFKSRRVAKEADAALQAGRFDEALSLYDRLADGTRVSSKRHSRALRQGAVASLLVEPAQPETAVELLDRLPNARDPEIAMLRRLASIAANGTEGSEASPASTQDAEEAEAPPASKAEAEKDAENEVLKKRIQRLELQLAASQTELKRKEEALEKLKAMVVGEG